MEIKLHNTTKMVSLNGVPARVWEGHTARGIAIHCFITRIAVEDSQDLSEFQEELSTASEPSPEIATIPLRLLI